MQFWTTFSHYQSHLLPYKNAPFKRLCKWSLKLQSIWQKQSNFENSQQTIFLSFKMHIFFSGESQCPKFSANPFKKDVCSSCQLKIQAHTTASNEEIKAALEYAVDKGIVLPLSIDGQTFHDENSLFKASQGSKPNQSQNAPVIKIA